MRSLRQSLPYPIIRTDAGNVKVHSHKPVNYIIHFNCNIINTERGLLVLKTEAYFPKIKNHQLDNFAFSYSCQEFPDHHEVDLLNLNTISVISKLEYVRHVDKTFTNQKERKNLIRLLTSKLPFTFVNIGFANFISKQNFHICFKTTQTCDFEINDSIKYIGNS